MSGKTKTTHIGVLRGCDARTPRNYRQTVRLRETKLYWVDQWGRKYSKKWNGSGAGEWPMYRLMLDTIEPDLGGDA